MVKQATITVACFYLRSDTKKVTIACDLFAPPSGLEPETL